MTQMPYWNEPVPDEEPRRKTGVAALPLIDACGQEYAVSFERPKGLPGFTRMILFRREADTDYHDVADIAEDKSLRKLRRIFDEFQSNCDTRIQYITSEGWAVPKGRISAFHVALKNLEARSEEAGNGITGA